ncbi:MAG: cycloartenol synthase, partial [Verrucomicrobiota bacterium]
LVYSRKVVEDTGTPEPFQLDWDAAISFVSRCQNRGESNDLPSLHVRPEDQGGFVYFPGNSKAGQTQVGEKKVALRSYGSMSYAGLLSFIYADLDPSDPRMVSVLTWLKANYTLEENPHMEAQGLYYYYHTLSKALSLAGLPILTLADQSEVAWKEELASRLLSLQKPDGSWINDASSRWWENDPALVTSYALLALANILVPPAL